MKTTFSAALRLGLVAAVGFAVAGCEFISEFVQDVSVKPVVAFTDKEANDIKKKQDIEVINVKKYMISTNENANIDKKKRNQIQSEIMARSDANCAKFRKFLFAVHGTRKLFLRSITLAMSGAGTIVTGGASQVFSGISTGFQGVDETYDAEILQKQAITLILQTIRSTRKSLKKDINDNRKKLEIDDYSVEAAVQDAGEYHNLCSLTEALAVLGSAVEENEGNKEKIKTMEKHDKDNKDTINRLITNGESKKLAAENQ